MAGEETNEGSMVLTLKLLGGACACKRKHSGHRHLREQQKVHGWLADRKPRQSDGIGLQENFVNSKA